jgi:hypothetical protein
MIILEKINTDLADYKILDLRDEKYNTDGTYKALEKDLKQYASLGYRIIKY